MKIVKLFCLLFVFTTHVAMGQNDYIVKTAPAKSSAATEEERFVDDNFTYYSLCNWVPGMKFMYVLEEKFSFIPTFYSYETEELVDNNLFHHKVMNFQGVEEREKDRSGRSFLSTRFIFEMDGQKYYHEYKNQRLNEICLKAPRSHIKGLVYLGDVDKARELLMNRGIYTLTDLLWVDDANSANGYRPESVPVNQKFIIKAVGVGSRQFPVKIILEDPAGRSFFAEAAFSTTNSGLVKSDFQGELRRKYFPNIFTFTDQHQKTVGNIKEQFAGNYIYPVRNTEAKLDGRSTIIFRYTPLQIIDMQIGQDKVSAILQVRDLEGKIYHIPTKLKYDTVIKNEDFIDDMFGKGNLRAEYPNITDEIWTYIVNGEIRLGMTKDECRLSIGSPIQIVANLNSRYETWFYNGRVLEFENGLLVKIK